DSTRSRPRRTALRASSVRVTCAPWRAAARTCSGVSGVPPTTTEAAVVVMAPFDRAPHTGRSPNTKVLSEIPDRTVVPVRSGALHICTSHALLHRALRTAVAISSTVGSAPGQGAVQRSCHQAHNELPSPKPEQTCLVCDDQEHESCSGGHPCVAPVAFPGGPSRTGVGSGDRRWSGAPPFQRV